MSKLNKQQERAVKYFGGPLLIVAGAGTGKTTVITEKIKFLIKEKLAEPEEILALTFTEKAAEEMQERVDIALPLGFSQMWISTFHSFCDQVLRQNGFHIGIDTNYKLMTQASTIDFFRKNIFEFKLQYFKPLGDPTKFVSDLLTHFSRLQDENIFPNEYLKWANKFYKDSQKQQERIEAEKNLELARCYEIYQNLKYKNSRLDFGDLINQTIKLFAHRPNVLSEYRNKFKFILIDEFQDTNYAQNKLALDLCLEGNITAVGDDDQSIYRFRGAAVSNITQFMKNFPKAEIVVLQKNYRSTQSILDTAYKLIKNNNPDRLESKQDLKKRLISVRGNGDVPEHMAANTGYEEARLVAEKIKKLSREENLDYKDFAILVRANSHAEIFLRELNRVGIPYQFLGPERLFDQPEIEMIIAYIKVLYDLEDSGSLVKLLSSSFFDIEEAEISRLLVKAKSVDISLFEQLKEDNVLPDLTKMIEDHKNQIFSEPAGALIYEFLEKIGFLSSLLSLENQEAESMSENVAKLFDKFKVIESEGIVGVHEVVDWINISKEMGESPRAAEIDWSENNVVNIMTIHSSKGLEFPVVFIVNLVDQRFPSRKRSDKLPIPQDLIKEDLPSGDFHLQEERRLMYVAMTRARDRLFLTSAKIYEGGKRSKKPSIFIEEALGETKENFVKGFERTKSVLSYAKDPDKQKIKESGDKKKGGFPAKIQVLSYSQIRTFSICPLHYKMRYILNLPSPPTPSIVIGDILHRVMQEFYQKIIFDKKSAGKKTLSKLLDKNWQRAGFMNHKHQKEAYDLLKEYLFVYYQKHFDPDNLPVFLEMPFRIKLPERKNERPLNIVGKIDRIDQKEGEIEIIDYKSGEKIPTQKELDNDLQLSFYGLAAFYIPKLESLIKKDKVRLTLYFFSEGKKLTTIRSREQLEKTVDEIYKYRKEIESSRFECSGHYVCQKGCEYSQFCAQR